MDEPEIPVRTPEENKKAAKKLTRSEAQAVKSELALARTAKQQHAAQLAQLANLVIAGYSFEQIGASIGATADEVERMLVNDTARYVRTQPSLRIFVRNFISGKYAELLEAVWDQAVDQDHPLKLENQDRAVRLLDRMAKLHGAEAPTQSEVKVDAAPEAVEKMVAALAASRGQGYDDSIFDVIDAEVVHEAVEESADELERSAREAGEPQEDDEQL